MLAPKTQLEVLKEQEEATKYGAAIYRNERTMAGEGDDGEAPDKSWELAKARAENARAEEAVKNLGLKAGAKQDPETGQWVIPEGGSLRGYGAGGANWRAAKGALGVDDEITQAEKNAIDAFGRSRSGGVIGPEEQKVFEEIAVGNRSESGLIAGLNLMQSEITAKKRELEAGAGAKAVKKTDKERKEIHNYKTAKPRPTER